MSTNGVHRVQPDPLPGAPYGPSGPERNQAVSRPAALSRGSGAVTANRGPLGYVFGNVAFVKHPAIWGVWVKTHASIVERACPACGAEKGKPCTGRWGLLYLHGCRRRRAPDGNKGVPRGA